ncbi:hypothetical protein Tco_0578520, partial [Tanacetum coccineum]
SSEEVSIWPYENFSIWAYGSVRKLIKAIWPAYGHMRFSAYDHIVL